MERFDDVFLFSPLAQPHPQLATNLCLTVPSFLTMQTVSFVKVRFSWHTWSPHSPLALYSVLTVHCTEFVMYPVPVAHAAVCGAKDKLENVPRMWEYVRNCVKGPGKCGRSLSDMFGGMSVENKLFSKYIIIIVTT